MNVGNVSGFNTVTTLKVWVSHVLPLVYDDTLSFMELLGKVTYKLNELIENNNKLPDYIADLIREYISSGEIEKVLTEVLANYMLNVKFPPEGLTPATGDGSADDTEAIQGCIDYAFNHGGMGIYFPSGSYLTQPLVLKNKCTMFGYDRYNTRLVLKGGATTAMFTGNVDELTLTGMGFDGNMDIQVNNVKLFDVTVGSAIITNVLLTDGYDLLNVVVNRDLQLDDVIFNHAVENGLVVSGNGYVQADNVIFKSVSALIGKNYVVLGCNDSILTKVKCEGASPNGVRITGNNNVVKMWYEGSATAYVDEGQNNSVEVYTVSDVQKFSGSVEKHVSGTVTNTAGSNVSETVGGKKTVQTVKGYEEIIGAGKTVNVTGNFDEVVSGDKDETAMNINDTSVGGRTETTGTNKTVIVRGKKTVQTVKGYEEIIGAGKTVNVTGNFDEVVSGDKDETAMNINDTSVGGRTETTGTNKTVIVKGNDSEDITGTKTENVGSNKQETVGGTKVETVAGMSTENANGGKLVETTQYDENMEAKNITGVSITETLTGDKNVKSANSTENVSGDKTVNAGDIAETSNNRTIHTREDLTEQVDGSKSVNTTGGETHTGKRMSVMTNDPLQYSKPVANPNMCEFFDYVPMLDRDNVGYNLLVYKEGTKRLDQLLSFYYADVTQFGADPTGVNDSTAAIQNALDSGKNYVVFPPGTYVCNWAKIPSNTTVIGYGARLVCTNSNTIFTNKSDGTVGSWDANANIIVEGLDFSAPNVDYCTPLGFGHCTNVTVRNCTFHDIKVWHFIEFNSCKSSLVDNCYFYNYGTTAGGLTEMVQLDYALNDAVFPWFGPFDATPTQDTKIVNCSFIGSPNLISERVPAAIGNHTGSYPDWKIIGTEISNCYFENLGSALKFVHSVNLNFNACYATDCENGVYIGGFAYGTNINNNILSGRGDWEQSEHKRGIYIEFRDEASMTQIIGNTVRNFGSHGVTCQGTIVNGFNNHIAENGCHGLYVGWNDFGSKYSDNVCWGNNKLAPAEGRFYDFNFYLTKRGNNSPENVGDALISNNKFTSAAINVDSARIEGHYQKSYFVMNFIKGLYVPNNNNDAIVYGNNWAAWNPTQIAVDPSIGQEVSSVAKEQVQLTAKKWTTVLDITVPTAGLWNITAFFATDVAGVGKGSTRILNQRNSYDHTIGVGENRIFYNEVTWVGRLNANQTVTLDVWDAAGNLTGKGSQIVATKLSQ